MSRWSTRVQHNVPLREIVFDTFGGLLRFVPLDQAAEELILQLRDAITPIDQPIYGSGDSLPWLEEDSLVIGYVSEDAAYAYPVSVLDRHEIVNDVINGQPVLITYCPLCFSGVVFSRVLDGRVLTFGNTSALYQSDLVMYDHQTGSYWFQVAGEAVVGTLTHSRLGLLPSTTMSWGQWEKLFPDSRLLTGTAEAPTAFASSRYGRDSSRGYQERINENRFHFPVDRSRLDDRLPSGEIILTVEVADEVTAFPLGLIGDGAVNHQVGGQPVVIFVRANEQAVGAFSPVLDGRTLKFDFRDKDESFVDQQTGTVWDAAGRGTEGPLAGSQLERLNTRRAFWFSVVIAFPMVDLYLP